MQVTKLKTKSMKIYQIENFLSGEECRQLIELVNISNDRVQNNNFSRETIYLPNNLEIIRELDIRIHQSLNIPENRGDDIQFQFYNQGGYLNKHYDFFRTDNDYDIKQIQSNGQRKWTFLIYLNDVESGGETYFVHENIKIKPKVGRAIYWTNTKKGLPNFDSLHEGCQVISGNKYIVTKGIRN